ncbi:hypothetical protein FRC11_001247, partial [Ceratobasidium sp. 423]
MPIRNKLHLLKLSFKSWLSSIGNTTSGSQTLNSGNAGDLNFAPTPLGNVSNDWSCLRRLCFPLRGGTEWEEYGMWDLRIVTEELWEFVNKFENLLQGQHEYEVMRVELERLFTKLYQRYHEELSTVVMTKATRALCWSIMHEISSVNKNRGQRVCDEVGYKNALLACYRHIHSHLNRVILNAYAGRLISIERLEEAIYISLVLPALYDFDPPRGQIMIRRTPCFENTRSNELKQVHTWARDPNSSSVFWINGMAGTGKTTIAYSLCEEFNHRHQLVASFFCSRSLSECRDVSRIIPSIAWELAEFSGLFRDALVKGARNAGYHPDYYSLDRQFTTLIAQPLLEVERSLPDHLVIVIDALDECDDKEGTCLLLELLLARASDLPVKFLVSSRPEPEIRGPMKNQGLPAASRLVLHELDRNIAEEEIATYLKGSLPLRMPPDSGFSDLHPTPYAVETLTQRSGGFFTYAATAKRHVSAYDPIEWDRELTRVVQSYDAQQNGHYSWDIDGLYTPILQAALEDSTLNEEDRTDMQRVLALVLVAQEPLTVDIILDQLKMNSTDRVWSALRPLWSVIRVSEDTGTVSTLHPSFVEYMLNPSRSGKYHCDPEFSGYTMTRRCFQIFRDMQPQFNVCGLESSYVPDSEITGLEGRVHTTISANTSYAAQHWAVHLHATRGSTELLQDLNEFLSTRLLLWMEIMNLKHSVHEMPEAIMLAKEWAESNMECSADLKALIHDSWRFTTTFTLGGVSKSTPHIYTSLIPLWPESTPISRCYAKRVQSNIRLEGTAIGQGQCALLATRHFDDATKSPVYSPDGRLIAVAMGHKVLLLDASTGQMVLRPFEGHSSTVFSLQFSPDGTRIISNSLDRTIRVWSTWNGETIMGPLEGHTNFRDTIAVSPDGAQIVSAFVDDTICVWDSYSGARLLGPLIGHHGSIAEVKYSPDNRWIITCGWNKVVIWDTDAGDVVKELCLSDTNITLISVDVSPDGTHIASCSNNDGLYVWSTETAALTTSAIINFGSRKCTSASFSPDWSRMASGFLDGTICVWDVGTGNLLLGPLVGHTKCITSVGFSPDGTCIISGSGDKKLGIWDSHSIQLILDRSQLSILGHAGSVTSTGFSPDGSRIITGSDDQTICVWDVMSGELALGPIVKDRSDRVQIAYSPNGTRILSNSPAGLVLLDDQTGNVVLGPIQLRQSIQSAIFSSDGNRILLGSTKDLVKVLAADTGHTLMGLSLPPTARSDWVTSIASSPDGACIAVGSTHSSLNMYDASSGRLLYGPIEGHNNGSRSFAFSPNSTRVVYGSFSTVW